MNTQAEQLKLDDDESIVRVVRKHWFILMVQIVSIIFLALAPFFLLGVMWVSGVTATLPLDFSMWYSAAGFLGAAWLLISWMLLFNILTDYYLDMWIITNKRVITIDQRGFFNRSVASFRLERLQDITVEIKGIIATMLDFGTIKADTASHTDAFVIFGIPNPREIKSLIQENADRMLENPSPNNVGSYRTGV